MHFQGCFFFQVLLGCVCVIAVFMGCPSSNANAAAGLYESTVYFFLCLPVSETSAKFSLTEQCARVLAWCCSFGTVKLIKYLILLKNNNSGVCMHTI